MNLSKHFTLTEFTKSPEAIRLGIDNTPTDKDIRNMILLCENVLEPVRAHYNKPIRTNSGFRSIALNTAIKGSRTSQHCFGQAADFEIMGVSNYDLAEWIALNLQFDQLILEYYKPGIPNSGWVHCSFVCINQNRHQCKTTSDGKIYLPGLVK